MEKTFTKFVSNQAIVLSFVSFCSEHSYGNAAISKNKIYQCCKDNNLQLLEFFEFEYYYDSSKFIELLKLIKRLKKLPIIIIVSINILHMVPNIMTYVLLSALEFLELIEIWFYLGDVPNSTKLCPYEKNSRELMLMSEAYMRKLFCTN